MTSLHREKPTWPSAVRRRVIQTIVHFVSIQGRMPLYDGTLGYAAAKAGQSGDMRQGRCRRII
jgi:hypothetical protein